MEYIKTRFVVIDLLCSLVVQNPADSALINICILPTGFFYYNNFDYNIT